MFDHGIHDTNRDTLQVENDNLCLFGNITNDDKIYPMTYISVCLSDTCYIILTTQLTPV